MLEGFDYLLVGPNQNLNCRLQTYNYVDLSTAAKLVKFTIHSLEQTGESRQVPQNYLCHFP